ncbi:F11 [Hirschfeldia incana]|nr:F11 [Hirschfeldia incana]
MERKLVGYRFSPTGQELVNHYLRNKVLDKPWLVNEAINEINICAHDPKFLPSLSKLKSEDLVWYFFTPRDYHVSGKKKGTKRTTPSGFWKATGVDRKIRDKGVEIGIKKTLVFHEGKSTNGVWTPWVMHEYHITSVPPTQRNYVICQVMYKGADGDSLYGSNSSELSHSTMVSDLNTVREINTSPQGEQPRQDLYMSVDDLPNPLNEQDDLANPLNEQDDLANLLNEQDDLANLLNEQDDPSLFDPDTFFNDNYCPYQQPQALCDDDDINRMLRFNGGNHADVLGDLDITMQEHCNDHRPKKALTGIIVDCSSSDVESISATPENGHELE